jgi:carboxylate-amine ligase
MDVSPRAEDALTLAAVTQSVLRMLWRLRTRNQRWRIYDRFLVGENRWRAQRYGITEGLIDFGATTIVPFPQLMTELVEMVAEDADALGCGAELEQVLALASSGTSAERQRGVLAQAMAGGADQDAAMIAVVDHLIEEFHRDL